MAYVVRFIKNVRLSKAKKINISGPLTASELDYSETILIKFLQRSHFASEIFDIKHNHPLKNKSILSLQPFYNEEDGLLRIGGRLNFSDLSSNQKHPILLSTKNHLVSLLLRQEHIRLGHAGAQTVLSNVRLKY